MLWWNKKEEPKTEKPTCAEHRSDLDDAGGCCYCKWKSAREDDIKAVEQSGFIGVTQSVDVHGKYISTDRFVFGRFQILERSVIGPVIAVQWDKISFHRNKYIHLLDGKHLFVVETVQEISAKVMACKSRSNQ